MYEQGQYMLLKGQRTGGQREEKRQGLVKKRQKKPDLKDHRRTFTNKDNAFCLRDKDRGTERGKETRQ